MENMEPSPFKENTIIYLKPEKPSPQKCVNCETLIDPYFVEPIIGLNSKISPMSNRWFFPHNTCDVCIKKISEEKRVMVEQYQEQRESIIKKERDQKMRIEFSRMIGQRAVDEYTLDKFKPSFDLMETFKLASNFDPSSDNFFIWGPAGVGKSHLAVAMARANVEKGIQAEFIKHAAMNRSMQGLKSTEYERQLNQYTRVPILIVDDLGTAKRTEFSDQVLYEVLDGRYSEMKNGLIITSNLSLSALAQSLGDDRLTSRIAGICQVLKMSGDDWRLKK